MAIVNMDKITIIGLESKKSQILKLLMKRGFVQIDDSGFLSEDENIGNYIFKDANDTEVMNLEQKLFLIEQAIDVVGTTVKAKKGFFDVPKNFQKIDDNKADELFEDIKTITDLNKNLTSLKASENALLNSKNILIPWKKLDIELETMSTKYTKAVMGTLNISVDVNEIRTRFDESAPETVIQVVNSDKSIQYVYILCHKCAYDTAMEIMRNYSFSPTVITDVQKAPLNAIKDYDEQIQKNKEEQEDVISLIRNYHIKIGDFENLYDYFLIEKENIHIKDKIVTTKATFCITGWLPAEKTNSLASELTEKYECFVESEHGNKDEGFPILLKNNKIVEPFTSVTNMYSCPGPNDIDPNPIMTFFYILFFGIMLSDAGYGAIIAIACGFIVYKKKFKKGEGNLFKMIGLCGLSTVFWGLIFGSIFGNLIPITPLIDPLKDVMLLMAISLALGLIHIYVGLGIKAYNLIKNGHLVDAICDVFLWYLFVTGVCILVIPVVAGDIGPITEVGKYLAIIGALGLVLTQGRAEKNLFKKLFNGVSSLYDITSYFADILSYSRLMALCLSTGVIAQVINLLGDLTGPVGAIFIGIIGHTANLLINALGAYVHTSRLQYVEFFGKFFEGGGIPFSPFKYKTKYTNINEEEM